MVTSLNLSMGTFFEKRQFFRLIFWTEFDISVENRSHTTDRQLFGLPETLVQKSILSFDYGDNRTY